MIIAVIAGFLTGILSSWGIGGGTLLILYMTMFAHVSDGGARSVNLAYFIPVAAVAAFKYVRDGLVELKVWLPAACAGVATAAAASFFADKVDEKIPKILFGILLLFAGVKQLFESFREGEGK